MFTLTAIVLGNNPIHVEEGQYLNKGIQFKIQAEYSCPLISQMSPIP